jgi:glycine cleavage system regulatory protein
MQKASYNTCKQRNLYAIENNSKAHNNKKHQSSYSEHQKQSATPKYCNKTQEFMYTKNLKLHTLECKNAFHNASKAQLQILYTMMIPRGMGVSYLEAFA